MSEPNSGGGRIEGADIRLFETGNFADATIICGDRTWNVHKVILASRCKWFKAAFYGNMAEAASGSVVLQEQNPELVDILLRFIYQRDAEADIMQLKQGPNIPLLCIQVFRLADFFMVDELKKVAIEELRSYFEFDVPGLLTTDLPDCEKEKGKAPKWLTEILAAVEEAYKDGSTAPILKSLVSLIYSEKHLIFRSEDALALLDKIPELGKDLMKDHFLPKFFERSTRYRLGLAVVKAAQGKKNQYLNEFAYPDSLDNAKEPNCQLYAVAAPGAGPFVPVYTHAGREQSHLRWMTPLPSDVRKMANHIDCPLVLVTMVHVKPPLCILFGTCAEARLYVDSYRRANSEIQDFRVPASTAMADVTMTEMMSKPFLDLS